MAQFIKDFDLVIEENENLTIAVVQRGGDGGGKNGIIGVVASSIAIAYASHLIAAPYVARCYRNVMSQSQLQAITIVGTLVSHLH